MSEGRRGQLDLLGSVQGERAAAKPAEPAPPRAIELATSEAFPLERVAILPGLELVMLPGQVGVSENGVRHRRSVEADLERLRGAALAVDLTTSAERGELGVSALHAQLRAAGLAVLALPTAPDEAPTAEALGPALEEVLSRLARGETVVAISRRGLGRAGTFAAAVLVARGASADEAIETVRRLRAREAVGSDAQETAIRELAARTARPAVETAPRDAADDVPEADAAHDEAEGDGADDHLARGAAQADEARDAWADEDEPDEDEPDEDEPDEDETAVDDDGEAGTEDDGRSRAAMRVASVPTGGAALTPRAAMHLGCVLGGAIGDAMGHPTEFLGMAEIRRRWGAAGVQGFELWWDKGDARFAPYTDDTQMAEAVLVSLLESREQGEHLDAAMQRMARHFVRWSEAPQGGHRSPGNACLSGCRALARGAHWSEAGGANAGGCGSVMRAYPFGLIFTDDLGRAERWAVAHSKLTHRDPIALAASAAMAVGVARIARGEPNELVLSEMIAAACRYSPRTATMMAQALDEALEGIGPEVTLDRNRGWAAHEAIAAAVYVLARHPNDARAAILEGANTPGDSDSIATLAGALVGTRVGVAGLPAEWVAGVERSAELAALAQRI